MYVSGTIRNAESYLYINSQHACIYYHYSQAVEISILCGNLKRKLKVTTGTVMNRAPLHKNHSSKPVLNFVSYVNDAAAGCLLTCNMLHFCCL